MTSETQHVDDYWDPRISKGVNRACRCAFQNKQESRQTHIGGEMRCARKTQVHTRHTVSNL